MGRTWLCCGGTCGRSSLERPDWRAACGVRRVARWPERGGDVVDDALLAGGVVSRHAAPPFLREHGTERLFDCQAPGMARESAPDILHAPMPRSRRAGPARGLFRTLNYLAFVPLASRAPLYGRL